MGIEIKKWLEKIKALANSEYLRENYVNFIYINAEGQKILERKLHELFPVGSPTEMPLSVLENMINESKEAVKEYNEPELIITDDTFRRKVISVRYKETEEETIGRLKQTYNSLISEANSTKEREYKEYQRLTLKYKEKETKNKKQNEGN